MQKSKPYRIREDIRAKKSRYPSKNFKSEMNKNSSSWSSSHHPSNSVNQLLFDLISQILLRNFTFENHFMDFSFLMSEKETRTINFDIVSKNSQTSRN